jgi:hypothetical protein
MKEGKPPSIEIQQTKVCWNAENLWECKLPRELTGYGSRVVFKNLHSVRDVQKVLYKGTYWFGRCARKGPNNKIGRNGEAILRLIAGYKTYLGPEPLWEVLKRRPEKGGIQRLRNLLATVDGLVTQIILTFPERNDLLDWTRIDQITHCMICNLLPDYFGRNDDCKDRLTAFEKVKLLRKAIKKEGFQETGDLRNIEIPREFSYFKILTDLIGDGKTPLDLYRVSLLCQTRASGVPPMSVYLKVLEKIKVVLTEPPSKALYQRVEQPLLLAVDEIHRHVLELIGGEKAAEAFWSSCVSKAKISLSDSGEFFTNTASGGKLEAARLALQSNPEIEEIDLQTGLPTGKILRNGDHIGTRLFHWACGHFRDRRNIYRTNVMSVRISLVAELGKYRSITVSHLAHALVLHVMSHVLLEYIRVIPSSASGVSAANHAWNFFKQISHKNPDANWIFGDKDSYLFSTDWEQATDYCDHTVAAAIINRLSFNVGFPRWYRETCCFALTAPRQVEEIDPSDKTLGCYYTRRGVLMGDPVTKVILHAYHLVARFMALGAIPGSLLQT